MEVGVWRDVKVVGVGDVVRVFLRGRLCGAMSILIAVAWAHARPTKALPCSCTAIVD